MRLFLLLAVLPLWAGEDANAILRRFVDAENQNDEKAKNYIDIVEAVYSAYDKNGQLHQNRTETFEEIFIEGESYRKLVARNGRPLDAKEQARVAKAMRQIADQRRKHPSAPSGGKISNGQDAAEFASDEEILTLFDNRVTGEEEIAGRKAWVIESTPKVGRVPANAHEKGALSFNEKRWIDEAENVELRLVYTATGERIFAKPGSTITADFQKVNQEVWQIERVLLDVCEAKSKAPRWRTEYHYSKFQKFDVQSTITMEPPK